jgi:hypothetical protein
MFSNIKLIQTTAIVAVMAAAAMAPLPASAGLLGDIEHAAKSVESTVAHPGKLTKDIAHDAEGAAKEVTHPKELVKDVEHAVKDGVIRKDLKSVGNVVGDVYDEAAKAAGDIPVAKEFTPLMRDAARAARSSEGEIAGAAGAGLAIMTGGTSYAATEAGSWGYAAFAGKREAQRAQAALKAQANSLRQ